MPANLRPLDGKRKCRRPIDSMRAAHEFEAGERIARGCDQRLLVAVRTRIEAVGDVPPRLLEPGAKRGAVRGSHFRSPVKTISTGTQAGACAPAAEMPPLYEVDDGR